MVINKDTPDGFAKEHLELCVHTSCKFCDDNNTCCFGMRDIGCPILNPDISRKTEKISELITATYMASIYEPNSVNEIREGVIDMITSEALSSDK